MKKQKETTFNAKSDDFAKAVSYSKRLLKQKLYHSNTIELKLKQKFTTRVVEKTMRYLEREAFFDNKLYIKKLKLLCIKKYYGIRRFKLILNEKGIYNQEHLYTFEEEAEVLSSFLEYCTVKYSRLSLEDFTKKVNYLVKYKGYSNFNIQRIVNI